jgi:hypothetical protein
MDRERITLTREGLYHQVWMRIPGIVIKQTASS